MIRTTITADAVCLQRDDGKAVWITREDALALHDALEPLARERDMDEEYEYRQRNGLLPVHLELVK